MRMYVYVCVCVYRANGICTYCVCSVYVCTEMCSAKPGYKVHSMYVQSFGCICTHTHTHTCVCVYAHIHSHTHTHIHTHTQTHTHITYIHRAANEKLVEDMTHFHQQEKQVLICVRMCVCVCMYVCMHVCMCQH